MDPLTLTTPLVCLHAPNHEITIHSAQILTRACAFHSSLIGMKKHTLDKRFNSAENIQTRTNRGAKRSKRSNRGSEEA